MYKLLYPKQPAVDEVWFRRILPYNEELFTVLGASHEVIAQYRQQFETTPFNPDLRPAHIDTAEYETKNLGLEALRSDILANEPHEAVRLAYGLKIDELITQNRLLIASANRDMETFGSLNRELYGPPDAAIFASVCAWVRQQAVDSLATTLPLVKTAAEQVLLHVPDLGRSFQSIVPDNHVFKDVRDLHFSAGGYVSQLFGDAVIPDMVSAETDGDNLTRNAIKAIGSNYDILDSTDEMWGVVHSGHAVVRPAGYKLPKAEFMGIVAHEVGSHLLERENGLNQPLRLLSIGLDKYECSNEGRAFLREQIMYHSPYEMLGEPAWEHIVLLYISAALGAGIHHKPYDFQTLYATIYPICLLLRANRLPDNPAFAELRARDDAWHLCVRAAKGTDGHGGAYLKALVYLDGNLTAWQLAATDPNIILFGDCGKFDISRSDHRRILGLI